MLSILCNTGFYTLFYPKNSQITVLSLKRENNYLKLKKENGILPQ